LVKGARYAYLVLAWLFLALLTVQVFVAGLGIFAGSSNWALHIDLGWALHLAPLLVLAAAALSRAGRKHWAWALAMAVVVFIVPVLVMARDDLPVVAALHPVAAMLAFGLAAMVARNSLLVIRDERREATA
jgi:cytochrome b subunit of formate dehydrogenase